MKLTWLHIIYSYSGSEYLEPLTGNRKNHYLSTKQKIKIILKKKKDQNPKNNSCAETIFDKTLKLSPMKLERDRGSVKLECQNKR